MGTALSMSRRRKTKGAIFVYLERRKSGKEVEVSQKVCTSAEGEAAAEGRELILRIAFRYRRG